MKREVEEFNKFKRALLAQFSGWQMQRQQRPAQQEAPGMVGGTAPSHPAGSQAVAGPPPERSTATGPAALPAPPGNTSALTADLTELSPMQ